MDEVPISLAERVRKLDGLELLDGRKLQRGISEIRYHCGPSVVAQLLASKN